ncbi:MAG: M10 family metallopeptidase C-terminal domain-containing protein, partial [Proteobacteria bacterium]|nr:M10 family metallopeptidase C-terminal domain-containing protein [Pseudomonadota bacterium]
YIDGASGTDTMTGGAGNDSFVVESVSDVVIESLNEGTDTVVSSMSYTLGANLENLRLWYTAPANGTGNELDNTIISTGANAVNVLSGLGGNDTLKAGTGDDTLLGGNGLDTLRGEGGADTLTGGADADTFAYTVTGDSGVGVGLRDIITDFLSGADRVDLSGIDANAAVTGNQAFTLIGATSTFTAAQQLAYHYEVLNSVEYTVIEGNVNASLSADFQLAVQGHHVFAPGTADLVL